MPKLTKRVVEGIAPEADREVLAWDSEIPGFAVRVWPSGKRSYLLKYRTSEGRQRKATIGRHGEATAEQARRMALRWLGQRDGADPAGTEAPCGRRLRCRPSQIATWSSTPR